PGSPSSRCGSTREWAAWRRPARSRRARSSWRRRPRTRPRSASPSWKSAPRTTTTSEPRMMDEHARNLVFGPFHEMVIAPDADDAPPDGFERMPTFGPYHQLLGPMYWRRED